MKSKELSWLAGLALACVFALVLVAPGAAHAQLQAGPQTAEELAGHAVDTANAFANPVAQADLSDYRGGTQTVQNDMTLAGTTADNTAYQVSTGSNAISAGAFANMSGIPVVIQNSGANVLIQNAVILHLQMN